MGVCSSAGKRKNVPEIEISCCAMATAPTIAMNASASALNTQAEPANEAVPSGVKKIGLIAQSIAAAHDNEDLHQRVVGRWCT